MNRDQRKIERIRLRAELDQLMARNEELRRRVQVLEIMEGLRKAAAASGRCPVCRGPVPEGEAREGRG